MAVVSHEDFVEGQQPLAIVETCLHKDSGFNPAPALNRILEQIRGGLRRVADQDAFECAGIGVEAQHELALQVFGDIGHEAILSQGHHHVLGFEHEGGKVRSIRLRRQRRGMASEEVRRATSKRR
jgi:hypothetical protein